jgi:hypothetical protein
MLPVTVAENVDPQMPLERFSRQGARELREEKNRLCRFKQKPRARNLAEFCGEVGPLARYNKYFYINELSWLCWQSTAKGSPLSDSLISGKIQGISDVLAPPCPAETDFFRFTSTGTGKIP